MIWYVYIIQSELDGSYYKGFSENPIQRLAQHNNGDTTSTKKKTPWRVVYIEAFSEKRQALIRERNLKKYSIERIVLLINSPKNIIHQFV